MSNGNIFHALGLHLHQPPGNLQLLIEANPWEAQQIIHCYDRATRYAHKYKGAAYLHIGFSGILLEQLRDPKVVDSYREYLDIPAMLNSYREAENIELIGMGYYHPIFPLIPPADWEDQLLSGRQLMQEIFGRAPKGFCAPEMALTMEMIPALAKAGYEYVLVESAHLRPADGVSDPYRPYRASYGGASITVVPRERDLSTAQAYGLDPSWFANEARQRAEHSPNPTEPRLITTWSDGENGGWFRQMEDQHGFFGHFFGPYIEHARNGEYPVAPVSLAQFLKKHPPKTKADLETGGWGLGSASEEGSQWNGSESQKQALAKLHQASARSLKAVAGAKGKAAEQAKQARRLILESETSCFVFWGDHWLGKVYERLDAAEKLLNEAEHPAKPAAKAETKPAPKAEAKPAEPVHATPPAKAEVPPAPAVKNEAPPVAAKPQPAAKTEAPPAPVKPAAVAKKTAAPAKATKAGSKSKKK